MGESSRTLISGSVLLGARKVMGEIAGPQTFDRAIATLDPATRGAYDGVSTLSWIPVEISEAVLSAVARELGRDPLSFMGEVTRANLHKTFNTLWKLLLRVTTDEALISRSPILYSKSYNRGELCAKVVTPGRAEVTVRGWPEISLLQIEALRVAVETTLTVAGRRGVKVVGASHMLGANFSAAWRV